MRYRCAIPARLNGSAPISAHQLYSTTPRPVKPRGPAASPLLVQPEADVQRHLEHDSLALDTPTLVEHLKPLNVAQRLLRPRHRVAHSVGEAHRRGTDERRRLVHLAA